MTDKIDEALGLGTALPTVELLKPETGHALPAEMEDDHQFARRNVRDLISAGKESLDQIRDIAFAAESPRAFEVVATLIDKLVNANEKLVDLSERGVKKETAGNGTGADRVVNNTQNVVVVGNGDDILKAFRKSQGITDIEDELER